MSELLAFIAAHLAFLFTPGGFRIVDSKVSETGGNALVILESDQLRIEIARDRSQLLFQFQILGEKRTQWFSQGLLRGWITGDRGGSEVLTPEWAEFLEIGLPTLAQQLRDPTSKKAALEALREQARLRARAHFG